jgi:hypothetical protein|tara:strand:+ start:725 stop:1042 length:318 start_codon:yes stop_codon:yes gene_type:complete
MKNTIAAIALITTASVASADFNATSEYAVQAEAITFDLAYSKDFGDFDLSALASWDKPNSEALDFSGTALSLGYSVSTNVRVYGTLQMQDDFSYEETVVGLSVDF